VFLRFQDTFFVFITAARVSHLCDMLFNAGISLNVI